MYFNIFLKDVKFFENHHYKRLSWRVGTPLTGNWHNAGAPLEGAYLRKVKAMKDL